MHHAEALERLKQGNKRFSSGLRSVEAMATEGRRIELAKVGQKPFAMVLSCADSRVPSEMVFDCGLGELFVVRVAGNIVAPSLTGSIEFAAENFGTELCVVMGHSQCGAVAATVGAAMAGTRPESDNVQNIVLEILPSVKAAMREQPGAAKDCLVHTATELNVRRSVEQLVERSAVIARLVSEGKLLVVGATYDLHTGQVAFLDDRASAVGMPLALYDVIPDTKAHRQAGVGKVPESEAVV